MKNLINNVMKKIIWYWNLLHYCVYQSFKILFRLLSYIDPLIYIMRVPAIKKFYSKQGVDNIEALTKTIANNPKTGINIIQTGIFMGSVFVLLTLSLVNYIQSIFLSSLYDLVFKNDINEAIFIFLLLAPSFIFNYFALFKMDKYLVYFEEFDKIDNYRMIRYYSTSFIIVAIMTFFIIFSFR